MITFAVGIAILVIGGAIGGRACRKAFGPDDRPTPAHTKQDGSDFVPMKGWRNSLINFLNIAGTGPILGPIQGILFGPIAFITIPIGCIIGGATHDYFVGMISSREDGRTIPMLVRKFLGNPAYRAFMVLFIICMMLVITVFAYMPADLAVSTIDDYTGYSSPTLTALIYVSIVGYFLLSAVLPIDKLIGRIYPLFGAMLIVATFVVFAGLVIGGYEMAELFGSWTLNGFDFGAYFTSMHFVPVFFVTVACGILSGFHATQVTLVSRTLDNERDGVGVFHFPMIVEGMVAMIWAAGTMAMIGVGASEGGITMMFEDGIWEFSAVIDGETKVISPTTVVYVIGSKIMGDIGGLFAAIACILLPVTSGDTALRAVRMTIAETRGEPGGSIRAVAKYTLPVVAVVVILLAIAKAAPDGFHSLWMYFSVFNQTIAVFSLAVVFVYFLVRGLTRYIWMAAIPLGFYSFVVVSYIVGSDLCLGAPWALAYAAAAVSVVLMFVFVLKRGRALKSSGTLHE